MKITPRLFTSLALAALLGSALPALAADGTDTLQQGFVIPPNNARPTVRWWWFGPAVVKPQLEHEMEMMKAGGFGGFEIQPTYPLALDGQYPGLVNLKFLSPEFLDMVGFTAAKAKDLGLRFDLTLGSGWPYGGPMFTRTDSAQSLSPPVTVAITPGQTSITPPAGGGGRGGRGGAGGPIVAALLGPVADAAPGASPYIALNITDGAAQLPADLHGATQVAFITIRQDIMAVKRPAYGAEGPVVDHYSPDAIAKFIKDVAEPEVAACGPNTPYTLFCDSLEVAGEGWTPTMLDEFKKRRGYDLTPFLPALFDNNFPHADAIRRDYGKTVMEVFDNNFVDTFTKFAHDHNSLFRIQAYGTPPTSMSTYAHADVSEGENNVWKAFSATRWAASASHMIGRPVTSAESFTWLHSPVFMAAPIDIKAESNIHFLNGINQILCHGWPYTAPGVEYPGWRFYAAAVFNDKNPWFIAMPDVTTYLARISDMLRQGTPANDVAFYLPEEDALATRFTPTSLQMNGILTSMIGTRDITQILEAGYNFDFVEDDLINSNAKADNGTLAFGADKYKVVVLPNVTRIPLATYQKLEQFANGGGILIAIGSAPSMAPGYLATDADFKAIQDISARLFTGPNAKGILIDGQNGATLGATLISKLRPDVAYSQSEPALGFVHRHTDDAEIYFLANTSNAPVSDTAIFRVTGLQPEWWNPTTGRVTAAKVEQTYSVGQAIKVSLAPYDAQLLVFTHRQLPAPAATTATTPATLDLSADWTITFKNASSEADPAPVRLNAGQSWTDTPALQYFSGTGTYEKTVNVPAVMLQAALTQHLDFGEGQPMTPPRVANSMIAAYQPPIGDAAVIYVNGQRAGALWCPPYNVDITGLLKAGANDIKIAVANRAVNYMSDFTNHPPADYSNVNNDPVYGAPPNGRAQPQNMNLISVQPSGLLGTVTLTASAAGN